MLYYLEFILFFIGPILAVGLFINDFLKNRAEAKKKHIRAQQELLNSFESRLKEEQGVYPNLGRPLTFGDTFYCNNTSSLKQPKKKKKKSKKKSKNKKEYTVIAKPSKPNFDELLGTKKKKNGKKNKRT
jgi:hypothetical protein